MNPERTDPGASAFNGGVSTTPSAHSSRRATVEQDPDSNGRATWACASGIKQLARRLFAREQWIRRSAATRGRWTPTKELIFVRFASLSSATRATSASDARFKPLITNSSGLWLASHGGVRGLSGEHRDNGIVIGKWWAVLGSNQWPLPCEGSALPLS